MIARVHDSGEGTPRSHTSTRRMKVDLQLENKKNSEQISQKPSNVNVAYDTAPTSLIKRRACSRRDSEAIAENVLNFHQASNSHQCFALDQAPGRPGKRGYMAWLLSWNKMAAVLIEEPRLEEKANEMPDEDDEIENLQEAGVESSSKKKKKKKKKKKGGFDFKQVCKQKN